MQTFYSPSADSSTVFLDENESRHLWKSLRLRTGDQVRIMNGKGKLFQGVVAGKVGRQVKVEELKLVEQQKSPSPHHLLIIPPKSNDRLEMTVEKCTELGIGGISFSYTLYSERRKIRLDRLLRIAVSACKQSGNLWVPELREFKKFPEAIEEYNDSHRIYVATLNPALHIKKKTMDKLYEDSNALVLCIGPEGDFSPDELTPDVIILDMGERVLRSETAAIFGASILKVKHENIL